MRRALAMLLAAAITTSGCATRGAAYVPLVDTKEVDQAKLAADVADCQAYAKERHDAAQAALIGALFGAALGAAVSNRYRGNQTAVGAAAGAGAAARGTQDTQERIIIRCLSGRGYSVLN